MLLDACVQMAYGATNIARSTRVAFGNVNHFFAQAVLVTHCASVHTAGHYMSLGLELLAKCSRAMDNAQAQSFSGINSLDLLIQSVIHIWRGHVYDIAGIIEPLDRIGSLPFRCFDVDSSIAVSRQGSVKFCLVLSFVHC